MSKTQNNIITRHKDDATSVTIIVEELRQEPHNPILLFKPQGSSCTEFPLIHHDGFLLIMQTEFQKELYSKYAHTVLCVDSTHGTNSYRFLLLTCMVVDDFKKGIYQYAYYIMYMYLYSVRKVIPVPHLSISRNFDYSSHYSPKCVAKCYFTEYYVLINAHVYIMYTCRMANCMVHFG